MKTCVGATITIDVLTGTLPDQVLYKNRWRSKLHFKNEKAAKLLSLGTKEARRKGKENKLSEFELIK